MELMKGLMWNTKYTPQKLSHIKGQNNQVAALQRFLEDFPKKKAILLYGPAGVGKTSTAIAAATENKYELIEINASDFRTANQIELKIRNAVLQQSLFKKKKLILIDELDGISGTYDRGGMQAISKIIEITKYPIILTANNPWDKKFSDIRKKSLMIEYNKLKYTSIRSVLKQIAINENIKYEDEALTKISMRASGDLRSAIIDLNSIGNLINNYTVEYLDERDRDEKIINALIKIFKTTSEQIAKNAFDSINEDYNQIMLWIDENIPYEYKKPIDLYRAYERIVRSDILQARIRKRQHWRFLAYIYYNLTVGIAIAKDTKYEGFSRLRPTSRILKIWQSNMRKTYLKKIASKISYSIHKSTKQILHEDIYYIKHIAKHDLKVLEYLEKNFNLDEKEVNWLKK